MQIVQVPANIGSLSGVHWHYAGITFLGFIGIISALQ